MIEQTIARSIEDICQRIPGLAIRDLGPATRAIQNLCVARAALTVHHSNGIESTPCDGGKLAQAKLAKELADRFAEENLRNLANL